MKTRILPCLIFSVAMVVTAVPAAFAGGPAEAADEFKATAVAPSPLLAHDREASSQSPLSSWSRDILKLSQAGLADGVVLSYITNATGLFNLTPKQIIHLKDLGVSGRVLKAMVQHDGILVASSADSRPFPVTAETILASAELPGSIIAAESDFGSILTPPYPPFGGPQIVATVEPGGEDEPRFEDFYAPEPTGYGPVRVPYAVKLNDPIVILRLPTFSVPCR